MLECALASPARALEWMYTDSLRPEPLLPTKPVMRGMHVNQIKGILMKATIFSTITSTAWYMLVNKPRKEAYKNFYATYDADADFERMKACGIFQSQAIIEEKMAEAAE